MIALMAYDLSCETAVFSVFWLKVLIQVIDFDLFVPCASPYSIQRKTALLRLILPGLFAYDRIDHRKNEGSHDHRDDPFLHADHVCCHANTSVPICFQRIKKIFYHLLVGFCSRLRLLL